MKRDASERIEWGGGECPVPPRTRVRVRFRNDLITTRYAEKFIWTNDPDHDAFHIVAYQVLT